MTNFPEIDWHSLGIQIPHGRNSGNVKVLCPKCSHKRRNKREPCLSVNLSKNVWQCHHCGWHGPEPGYAKERRGLTTSVSPVNSAPLTGEEREKPKVYRKPEPPQVANAQDDMYAFFETRGISRQTVNAYGVYQGFYTTKNDKKIKSICIPYYRDGELINIKYRLPQKRFIMETGAELAMYNLDRVQGVDTVIVVEGEMDVLALAEAGYTNVISTPNGAPPVEADIESASLEYLRSAEKVFARARKVILAGDSDEPGRRLMDEFARRIGKGKCWRVEWPEGCKDANDVLIADSFDGGAPGLRAALDMAIPYPVDGITTPGDYEELLWKYEQDTEQGARVSNWPHFSDMCRFTPGQLSIVTGVPSSGKSQWLNSVLLDMALTHGWNIGIFSPEYFPKEIHVRDLVENITGKVMNHKFIGSHDVAVATRQDVRAALAKIDEKISFILPPKPTLPEVLERAHTLVYRRGIKMLIIDPWTEIDQAQRGEMSMTDWVDECLKALRRFGREHDVHVVIVAHPKKMPMETDREGTRRQPVITPYDIAESRHWYEMADIILSVWRDKSDPSEPVQVHIQKVRFQDNGELGVALFKYDRLTRRYTDITDKMDAEDYEFVG